MRRMCGNEVETPGIRARVVHLGNDRRSERASGGMRRARRLCKIVQDCADGWIIGAIHRPIVALSACTGGDDDQDHPCIHRTPTHPPSADDIPCMELQSLVERGGTGQKLPHAVVFPVAAHPRLVSVLQWLLANRPVLSFASFIVFAYIHPFLRSLAVVDEIHHVDTHHMSRYRYSQ